MKRVPLSHFVLLLMYILDYRMFSFYRTLRDPLADATDNCVVNVIPIGDELVAVTETDYVHQIDSKTLDSTRRVNV